MLLRLEIDREKKLVGSCCSAWLLDAYRYGDVSYFILRLAANRD